MPKLKVNTKLYLFLCLFKDKYITRKDLVRMLDMSDSGLSGLFHRARGLGVMFKTKNRRSGVTSTSYRVLNPDFVQGLIEGGEIDVAVVLKLINFCRRHEIQFVVDEVGHLSEISICSGEDYLQVNGVFIPEKSYVFGSNSSYVWLKACFSRYRLRFEKKGLRF